MKRPSITKMALCAMFAAITAALSQIVIPIGPVPINLATFSVFCAGALLGPGAGALSMTVWAALGAAGLPVFAMFRGGLQVLGGHTGGFIIGYIPAAFLTGLIIEKSNSKKILPYPLAMLAGALVYFTIGTAWFIILMKTDIVTALLACVIPFIPGELLKMAAAVWLSHRLRPILYVK